TARAAARTASGPRAVLDDSGVDVDYLALRAPDLGEAPAEGDARLLVAGRVGTTRLIDNVGVPLGAAGVEG
ncbi:pantoate--beta-alanine ligase, partial [Corynebacterium bovis]